jgi:hypothetical protein
LYPGQTVQAELAADEENVAPVNCRLYIRTYGPDDELIMTYGPAQDCVSGARLHLEWRIPDTGSAPIATIGLEISAPHPAGGTVYLDYLTWDGAPDVVLTRPAAGGTMWRRAWVQGVDVLGTRGPEPFRLTQNRGRGLLIQGTRDWRDYRVSATITPRLVSAAGIGARVQGMRRYYALMLCTDGTACLVKALDGDTVLASAVFPWEFEDAIALSLEVIGMHLKAWIDGTLLFDVDDTDRPLDGGAVALLCEQGSVSSDAVTVRPAGWAIVETSQHLMPRNGS